MNIGVTLGGYAAAGVLFLLFLDAREDLASEIEACNTRTVESAREASEMARQAEREAADAEIARIAAIASHHDKARQMVADALREAEARDPVVRTVIKEVARETEAAQCLDLPVPADVLGSVRP